MISVSARRKRDLYFIIKNILSVIRLINGVFEFGSEFKILYFTKDEYNFRNNQGDVKLWRDSW